MKITVIGSGATVLIWSANKDGQPEYVTGNLYARHFKVFADSMKKAALQTGKTIYIGAVMQESQTQSWQTVNHPNLELNYDSGSE